MTPNQWKDAVLLSLHSPRQGAAWLIRQRLELGVAVQALVFVSLVSAVLSSVAFLLFPVADVAELGLMARSPFVMAGLQLTVQALGCLAVFRVGKRFGGRGRLPDTVALMAWLEALMILLQLAQLVLMLAIPPLAEALGFLGVGLFFWLLTQFVTELHGFRSAGKVFVGVLGCGLVLSLALMVVLALLIGPEGLTNV